MKENVLTLSKANLTLERDISPPLKSAISLPVLIDDKDLGLVIYVAQSAFHARTQDHLVRQIADRLILRPTSGARREVP
jgi:hypothetical protein